MKRFIRAFKHVFKFFGFDLVVPIRLARELPRYLLDFGILNRQRRNDHTFRYGALCPCLGERNSTSGVAKGHYFHQDLLVARRIFLNAPDCHVDVGSRVDGFVAHVATFRTINVIDIRKQSSKIPNVSFVQADLMSDIREELRDYCDSLSCLHALEHFGLGRYGDPVNYNGHLAGLQNLTRILKPGGKLYLSVPIGPQRIEFNAHRVFTVKYLLGLFDQNYRLDHFSYVDDQNDLHVDVPMSDIASETSFECIFGCGIFEMTKRGN